jgi:transposase-like protein
MERSSAEFKRELVTRSLEPGVSVAAIAMGSGINAPLTSRPGQNILLRPGGSAALA